jgi:hypothetical protein
VTAGGGSSTLESSLSHSLTQYPWSSSTPTSPPIPLALPIDDDISVLSGEGEGSSVGSISTLGTYETSSNWSETPMRRPMTQQLSRSQPILLPQVKMGTSQAKRKGKNLARPQSEDFTAMNSFFAQHLSVPISPVKGTTVNQRR